MPDFTKPFTLHTDWSKCAIGAVLSQSGVDGLDHPMAFANRTLNPAERNYAPIEGECLALTSLGCQEVQTLLPWQPFPGLH